MDWNAHTAAADENSYDNKEPEGYNQKSWTEEINSTMSEDIEENEEDNKHAGTFDNYTV